MQIPLLYTASLPFPMTLNWFALILFSHCGLVKMVDMTMAPL